MVGGGKKKKKGKKIKKSVSERRIVISSRQTALNTAPRGRHELLAQRDGAELSMGQAGAGGWMDGWMDGQTEEQAALGAAEDSRLAGTWRTPRFGAGVWHRGVLSPARPPTPKFPGSPRLLRTPRRRWGAGPGGGELYQCFYGNISFFFFLPPPPFFGVYKWSIKAH